MCIKFEEDINNYELLLDKEMTNEEYESYIAEIMPLIGELVITFNRIDSSINIYIKDLVSNSFYEDEIPYIFISEMNYSSKINVLKKLYNYFLRTTQKEYKKDLEKIISELQKAGTIRNNIIHAEWDEVSKDYMVKIKTKVKQSGAVNIYRIINSDTIKKEILFIEDTQENLEKFDDEYMER